MELNLLTHQAEFLADTTTRNLALIGGYGSGKTKALALKLIVLAMMNPGCEGIALSPTYQMAAKVLVPTIQNELRAHGLQHVYNKTENVFRIKIGARETLLHIMAAEIAGSRAAGINGAFFGIDEADLLGTELFIACWQMLSSRLREGNVYQGVAVSTPEGFKGCYKFWVEEVLDAQGKLDNPNADLSPKDRTILEDVVKRRIIRASTYDNPFLPPSYIAGLEAQYPPHLIKAYLLGDFVNLAGKPVYWKFDKEKNVITDDIRAFNNLVLHVGIDFNAGINATVIHVVKNDKSYAIDEIYGAEDTQVLANEIKKRFPMHYEQNQIRFYPDSAGFEGIQNLKRNFPEYSPSGRSNFRTVKKDVARRVAAVNEKFQPVGSGPESFVNAARCPNLMKGLLQQTYMQNEKPDDKSGIDHALDAHGYFIHATWPLSERVTAYISE